jgi:hypothetical protein
VSSQCGSFRGAPARASSASRKETSQAAAWATGTAPSRCCDSHGTTSENDGAASRAAREILWTCSLPKAPSAWSSVSSDASTTSPRTRWAQISITRSRFASRPVISRSMKRSGASDTGPSHGGPGGGSPRAAGSVTGRCVAGLPHDHNRRRPAAGAATMFGSGWQPIRC